MVNGFFQEGQELFAGTNNDELDKDTNDSDEVRPASKDDYGDPADEYSNLPPDNQQPYGDPADEYGR